VAYGFVAGAGFGVLATGFGVLAAGFVAGDAVAPAFRG